MRTRHLSQRSLTLAMWLLTSTAAVAQFTPTGQFAPPSTPPYDLDQITGEWINLETELIEPVVFVGAGGGQPAVLAVVNEPDDRVVFLDTDLSFVGEVVVGQGPASLARNPDAREIWVSVRNQSSVVVVDVASRGITHVLRPPIPTTAVGAGHASTPGGIAFANGRAFVAASFSDELLVYDAASKAFVTSIPLQAQHNGNAVALNDPFGVTSFGGRIFVTSHLSGNNTTARIAGGLDLDDPGVSRAHLGPDEVTIETLVPASGFSLPDFDVAVVDPVGLSVTAMVKGVGTVLFTAAGDPISGRVAVTNLEARNGAFVGEEAFPQGKVAFNRLTWIDPATATVVGTPVVTEALGTAQANLVMPTDVEIVANGRMYVAGYGSSNVAVFSPAGVFEGAIVTPAGPRGLAYSRPLGRLFCLNRAANSVTSYDIANPSVIPSAPLATFTLTDPTFDHVKAGRIEFLKPNSGAGTASCASCHVDGRMDGIAWNLSKTLSKNPVGPTPDFRDRKGVMVTQDLRGLSGSAPYHWRGEQKDIEDFNGAFEGLLKGQKLATPQLALFKDYVLSLEFPPNPHQQMNRAYTAEADGGHTLFGTSPINNPAICAKCHALPLGTSGDITEDVIGDEASAFSMEVAALRGFWTKTSAEADIDASTIDSEFVQSDGFGLLHEGVVDNLDDFMDEFFGGIAATDQDHIVRFIDELDTGLGEATMYSELLDSTTANTPRADSIEHYLLLQADAGNCDVAARGLLDLGAGMVPVGLVYRPGGGGNPGVFELDDIDLGTTSFAQLQTSAAAGQARLLFMGVPRGSGDRIGVDRDRDGMRDTDELQHVPPLDPDDPDFDNDGLWDSYDLRPAAAGLGAPSGAPQVITSSVHLVYQTTDSIKIAYDTTTFSPTIVKFGKSAGALVNTTGDGLQPVGPGTTNHWKKHHTAFLRPQPLATSPLTMLDPATVYFFEIVTQGQNGATATTGTLGGVAPYGTLPNFPILNTFRGSALDFVTKTNNGNGTFTYAVTATFVRTQGLGSLTGGVIPGRFTIYDAAGNYVFTNSTATIVTSGGGVNTATFQITTAVGQQTTGDRVTFDLPMWLPIGPPGATTNVPFPIVTDNNGTPLDLSDDIQIAGQWSDSVTAVETIAP